jgi:predicted unusual protein kinase regulating ubiquinone biosynthesis (AarF/ABC1/UbiB family)
MASLKTRPFERNLALAKLGLGAGTQIITHSLVNIFRGEVARSEADREFYKRQAEILAAELGKLKGSVMKAGQMLSLYGQYFLPEEAVAVLAELQEDTPPVQWRVVLPVLEKTLGPRRMSELEIDEVPIAAASLGQAHRARRKSDGLEVVVKIQYPGVADAIESDISTLSRLLLMSRLTPKELDLKPMFAEVRDMLMREVDYVAERAFTEDFGRRLAHDSRFVVPRVIGEYCSNRVLTTTYERGTHVDSEDVQKLSLQRRNRLGHAFIELFMLEFFRWGMVQTDPHFGNYRFRIGGKASEDQIVLLDFGATRHFAEAFKDGYSEVVRGALLDDRDRVFHGARAIGLMPDEVPDSVIDPFMQVCRSIVEPFKRTRELPPALVNSRGAYRWGDTDLPMRVANLGARSALSVHFRMPPRELVFLHRRLAGVFIMLAKLRAELNARPLVVEYLDLPRAS